MLKWKDEIQAILLALAGGVRYGVKIRFPHAIVMTYLFRKDLNASEKIKQIITIVQEHATNLAIFAALYKSILLTLKCMSHRYNVQYMTSNNKSISQVSYSKFIGHSFLSLLDDPYASDYSSGSDTNVTEIGYPRYPYHSFIAGVIGGYYVWGRYSSLNYQIVLYLTSRVFVALLQRYVIEPFDKMQQRHQLNVTKERMIKSMYHIVRERIYSGGAAIVWGIVMYLFEVCPHVLHPSLKSSMDEIYRYTVTDLTSIHSLS